MTTAGRPAADPAAAGAAVAGHQGPVDTVLVVVVAAVALTLRLVPVLRGGGFFGASSYDGSVYYAAAAGLAHGLVPYRDFLLLHPPGIVLALLPFAEIGRMWGDPEGLAAARVAFLLVGALNAVLVSRLLRPQGRWAATVGGLFYAAFFPAIFMERADSLEAAATFCLLGALVLLTRPRASTPRSVGSLAVAGLLLGFGTDMKIWGVVVAATVIAWFVRSSGLRSAVPVTCGAVTGIGLVCAPFFLSAPGEMWRMVVVDQVGRPRSSASVGLRAAEILGLAGPGASPLGRSSALLVVAALVVGFCLLLAARSPVGGLAAWLVVSCTGLLLLTPTWFAHYAGLAAAPLALLVGAAMPSRRHPSAPRWAAAVLVSVVGATVVASVAFGATRTFGTPYPGKQLALAAARTPGCVTSDDSTALIESGLLRRNFSRHCPLVVDLGGYSYDIPGPDARFPRSDHPAWQRYALHYLGSGSITIVERFHSGVGFSRRTASAVGHWPTVAHVGRYRIRRPTPRAAG